MGSRHEVEKKSGVDAGDRNGRCVVCISLFTLWMLEVLQLPELVRLANGSPRERDTWTLARNRFRQDTTTYARHNQITTSMLGVVSDAPRYTYNTHKVEETHNR
jgi:hypothetical protein